MLRIFSIQVLPLLLALLGAIFGAALGIFLGPSSRWWSISIAVLSGLVVMALVYLIFEDIRFERRVQQLGERIREEIDLASAIDYDMLDAGERAHRDGQEMDQTALAVYHRRIEDWRTRVDTYLARELPNSGADIRFRTASGDVNRGWGVSIYTRLTILRANLMAVLDNLPTYVQRSR